MPILAKGARLLPILVASISCASDGATPQRAGSPEARSALSSNLPEQAECDISAQSHPSEIISSVIELASGSKIIIANRPTTEQRSAEVARIVGSNGVIKIEVEFALQHRIVDGPSFPKIEAAFKIGTEEAALLYIEEGYYRQGRLVRMSANPPTLHVDGLDGVRWGLGREAAVASITPIAHHRFFMVNVCMMRDARPKFIVNDAVLLILDSELRVVWEQIVDAPLRSKLPEPKSRLRIVADDVNRRIVVDDALLGARTVYEWTLDESDVFDLRLVQ